MSPIHRNLDDLIVKLQEKDYKLTPQRRVILQAFLDNRDRHLSADELFGLVKPTHPEIGLATIYRTLDLLSSIGLLAKLDFGDGRHRYEFTDDSESHHHHHLVCTRCNGVEEFEDDLLESLEALVARQKGFKIHDHELKFYGICAACQKRSESV